MVLFKIMVSLFIYILLVLSYIFLSVMVNIQVNIIMFSIVSVAIIIFVILSFKGKVKKKFTIGVFKKKLIINKAVIALAVLVSICFIEGVNFVLLEENKENTTVYKKVKDLIDYDKLFKTAKYGNNTIYYTPEFEPALKLINVYLQKADADNKKIFGDINPSPFTVKFDYDEQVFRKRVTTAPKATKGAYINKHKTAFIYGKDCYREVFASGLQKGNIKETVVHEYTHHMFCEFMNSNQISLDKIPLWFNEGISEYIANKGSKGYPPEKLVDFNELKTSNQWTKYTDQSYSTYEQSQYAVSQLIFMKGENVIKDILLRTKNADFNTAFKDTMGFSMEDFQKSFNEDFKANWKEYDEIWKKNYEMNKPLNLDEDTKFKIQCFEKYVQVHPDNINALIDLATIHENRGELDKAKIEFSLAVKQKPDSSYAWRNLAIIYEELNDFDNAIKAYEKEASLEANSNERLAITYTDLAQVWLLKDINKAVEFAQKAKEIDKSSYINTQAQEVINLKSSIEKGKPYEGCLQIIKSETIHYPSIKKTLINKMLKDYPLIRCEARNQLEKINSKL